MNDVSAADSGQEREETGHQEKVFVLDCSRNLFGEDLQGQFFDVNGIRDINDV